MNKKMLIVLLLAIAGAAIWMLTKSNKVTDAPDLLTYSVKKGPFSLSVKATGELQAKNSKRIMGPRGMQQIGIYNPVIDFLVPEGTVVKKGDYMASINKNDIANKITEVSTELDRVLTQLEQAKIDTAIDLRSLRDQISNLLFTQKEKELQVQQSRFEPEMVVRQAKLDLERTERDLAQYRENLKLKEKQARAKVEEINTLLRQQQNRLTRLQEVAAEFTIMAPEDGMVIYARTWNGKIQAGSQLNGWDPVVAELPDLSDMISKSYVNEVDINKIKVGLKVDVKVDALPDRTFSGKVTQVANVGEELRGFDSKVFEVIIQILEVDSLMRPAMTTGAEIFIDDFSDVIAIPLDALFIDSLSFVYKMKGNAAIKQEVIPGSSSDMMVIIDYGLEDGDQIIMGAPPQADKLKWEHIDEKVKSDILAKQEEEQKKRRERWAEKAKEVKEMGDVSIKGGAGNDMIIILN